MAMLHHSFDYISCSYSGYIYLVISLFRDETFIEQIYWSGVETDPN